MPSHIDEAGHTKAFDYPVAEHWGGKPKCSVPQVGLEPTIHGVLRYNTELNSLPTEPPGYSRGSHNPGSSTGGIFSQPGG